MIVLVQFGINKHLLIFAQTTNLLLLVYSKLHLNSCDYLQIEPLLSEVHVLFCLVFLAKIWKIYMIKTEFDT